MFTPTRFAGFPNKLLAAVVAASLVAFALSACGGGEEAPPAQNTPTTEAVRTPATTPTPQPNPTVAPSGVLDLATTVPKLTIFAADVGDLRNDRPALAVGDFNGDTIADLLMGARFGDGPNNSRQDAGEAYVIFGSSTLPSTVDIASQQQNLTIFGAQVGDNLGYAVAAADVNHDAIDDILVSAPMSNGPGNQRTDLGETYVIFGSADLGGVIDIGEGKQDVTVFGAEGFSLLGDSLATGDVNDDGIDDIIMGAPFAGRVPGSPPGGPRTELGEVYVVFGSPTLGGLISIPENQQDFTIAGAESFAELGDTVVSGDVNGDGIDDIIAVAEAAGRPEGATPNAGATYVVLGSRGLSGAVSIAESEQDLSILGADRQDALGFSAAVGDVNGDDIDDILLVAQRAGGPDNTRDTAGEAYVIFGSSDLKGTIDVAANEQDTIIFGADAHDLLSFSGADDINGDGIGDIALGTSFAAGPDNARDGAGEVDILFGSPDLPATIDLAQGGQHIVISGAEANDRLGSSMAVGDLDGDGKVELILVATDAAGPDNVRPQAGEVYVVAGVSRSP
jgi:hypothetical protein